jgi:hypothetical protein
MCLSCFAGLAKEVLKLRSAKCKGGDAVTKAPSLPTKAPSLSHSPIQAAVLEPALALSLKDEVLRRKKAEAEGAALQRQLGQVLESGQELEKKLLEATAAEVRPGDARSLCVLRSRLSELQAQLNDERSKIRLLEARLLQATLRPSWTDPDPQMCPRGDLSERISKEREICNLQEQLVQEISKRTELQSHLESFHRQSSGEHALRRGSCDLASPRGDAATTPTRAQSPTPSSTCARTPSEPSSAIPSTLTPCFGGRPVKMVSLQSGVSFRSGTSSCFTPRSALHGERPAEGRVTLVPVVASSCLTPRSGGKVTLVPAGTSSCLIPRSALQLRKPVVAGGQVPLASGRWPVAGGDF